MKKVKTTTTVTCTAIPNRNPKVVIIVFEDGAVEVKCPIRDHLCYFDPCGYERP
jgi:hypothetical protein